MFRNRILVVDDDAQVRALCAQALIEEGYAVLVARNGPEALRRAQEESPQLIVVDVLMPGMDGIELCRNIRSTSGLESVPLLLLTARGDIADKAAGFAVGADDYLTKPFDMRELTMRVRALMRRASRAQSEPGTQPVIVGELRLDPAQFNISTPQKTVQLTPAEFDLMHYLMRHAKQVHSAQKLLVQVWNDPGHGGSCALVRRHIKNIRDKIEPMPSAPRFLRTVRSHGYTVG